MLNTIGLFALTALAEIIGCYLPYLWLKQGKSIWLLLPAAVSLALFAWLLTLHPTAAGRVYAAYGGCMWRWRLSGYGWWTVFARPIGTCWAPLWPCSAWRSSCLRRAIFNPFNERVCPWLSR